MARIYISAGSNQGNCLEYLSMAAQMLPPSVKIIRTSPVYITEPWGYKEQPSFYNLVWEAETALSEESLLRYFKQIEQRIGRIKTLRYGPRVIDLDIILYDDRIYHSADLDIPHLQMPCRRFVLQPLCDLIPAGIDPRSGKPFHELLEACPRDSVTKLDEPFNPARCVFRRGLRTYVMGIVNLTPDSFSGDGCLNDAVVLGQCERFLKEGADILDFGAESTRPGSTPVSAEEEIRRLIPILEMARSAFPDALFSVDSGKAETVRAALDAGVDWINNTGNIADRELMKLCAESGKPVILMRSRPINPNGEILTEEQVIGRVRNQLIDLVNAALKEGMEKNNIILDPGIGFGSNENYDLMMIRGAKEFRTLGFPLLLGARDRKSVV